jgi:hypothetical protein
MLSKTSATTCSLRYRPPMCICVVTKDGKVRRQADISVRVRPDIYDRPPRAILSSK